MVSLLASVRRRLLLCCTVDECCMCRLGFNLEALWECSPFCTRESSVLPTGTSTCHLRQSQGELIYFFTNALVAGCCYFSIKVVIGQKILIETKLKKHNSSYKLGPENRRFIFRSSPNRLSVWFSFKSTLFNKIPSSSA